MEDFTDCIGTQNELDALHHAFNSSKSPPPSDFLPRESLDRPLSDIIQRLEAIFCRHDKPVAQIESGNYFRQFAPNNQDSDSVQTAPSGAIAPDSSLHSTPPSFCRGHDLSSNGSLDGAVSLPLMLQQAQYHLDNAHLGGGRLERAAEIFNIAAGECNSLDGLVGLCECNYFGVKTEEPVYQSLFTLMDMRMTDSGARQSLPYLKLLLAFSEASGLPPQEIDGLTDDLQAGLAAKWDKTKLVQPVESSPFNPGQTL